MKGCRLSAQHAHDAKRREHAGVSLGVRPVGQEKTKGKNLGLNLPRHKRCRKRWERHKNISRERLPAHHQHHHHHQLHSRNSVEEVAAIHKKCLVVSGVPKVISWARRRHAQSCVSQQYQRRYCSEFGNGITVASADGTVHHATLKAEDLLEERMKSLSSEPQHS